jgi:hypothetical protein
MWPFSETNAAAMRTRKPAGLHRRALVDGTFAPLGSFMMAAAEPGNRQSRREAARSHARAAFYGLERDDFSSKRHLALSFCLSMISAQTRSAFVARENRYPLFRIML